MSIGKTNSTAPTIAGESQSTSGGSNWNSSSGSGSTDPSSIWGGQSPYLKRLYRGAQGLGMGQQGQQQAQGVYDTAIGGFNQMMNPGINPQLQAYSGQVQNNLERNLLPAIQGAAGQFGQMGGARQGVAEGLALGDSNQQITDMAANLYNQDQNRTMQAMSMAPGLSEFGAQIPWYNMNQYAGILGAPTTLTGGSRYESSSSGGGSDWSQSTGTTASGGGGGGGWEIGIPVDM